MIPQRYIPTPPNVPKLDTGRIRNMRPASTPPIFNPTPPPIPQYSNGRIRNRPVSAPSFIPAPPKLPKSINPFFKVRTVEEGKVIPLSRKKVNLRPVSALNPIIKTDVIKRPSSASARFLKLSQIETTPRPSSASRTFNKFKPL
jgi:hypothetical protein